MYMVVPLLNIFQIEDLLSYGKHIIQLQTIGLSKTNEILGQKGPSYVSSVCSVEIWAMSMIAAFNSRSLALFNG